VSTHAGAIAEKLQGAHERRQRGEDKDMSRDDSPLNVGESVWDDDPFVHAMKLVERLDKVLNDIAGSGHAPGDPQASAVSAERVVELERQLAEARKHGEDLSAQLDQSQENYVAARQVRAVVEAERDQARELLATAYVAREVPWTDVAAGMMTLSREDHPRPWMVTTWGDDGKVMLNNGTKSFHKTPADGETVRVLVPYVTKKQAEGLVASELGGTEVGS
jgi:hypothetical protein